MSLSIKKWHSVVKTLDFWGPILILVCLLKKVQFWKEGYKRNYIYKQIFSFFLCVNVSNSICILRSGAKSEVKCYHQDKTLSLLAPSFKQMTQ